MTSRSLLWLLCLVSAFALLSCKRQEAPAPEPIVDDNGIQESAEHDPGEDGLWLRIAENPSLSTFLELADSVGMKEWLADSEGVTLLVPSNEAFERQPSGVIRELRDNPALLRNVIANHIAMGTIRSRSLQEEGVFVSLAQVPMEYAVTVSGGTIRIGDGQILEPDIEGGGKVMHVVDMVFIPDSFDPDFEPGPFGPDVWRLPEDQR